MEEKKDDDFFMAEAYKEAEKAFQMDEVPIGAVVVCEGKIIARGHNMTQRLTDVTAHAEMIAITSAANFLNSKYLNQCTLFVTLEPCLMCAGACSWAKLKRLVYGAKDPRKGFSICNLPVLHPKTTQTYGVLEKKSSEILKQYFMNKRNQA